METGQGSIDRLNITELIQKCYNGLDAIVQAGESNMGKKKDRYDLALPGRQDKPFVSAS